MKVLGLTGGIGSGKSVVADLVRQRGLPVVDSDVISRQLVEPGQPALAEISTSFGPGVIDSQGNLDRKSLASKVFSDPAARAQLEAILHPRIRALWQSEVARWRAESRPIGVVVIPLLFESQAEAHFDKTVCVACSAETQHSRLAARGWSSEQIRQRLEAQWPVEKKIAKANYVLWNEATVEVLSEQLQRVLAGV